MIDYKPPVWKYHGQYKAHYPSVNRRLRRIAIPADAPDYPRYEIFSRKDGALLLMPAKVPEIAPIQVAEG